MADSKAAGAQGNRILLAKRNRLARQTVCFGCLLGRISHPPVPLAQIVAPGGHPVGGGKLGVEIDGAIEQTECVVNRRSAAFVQMGHPAKIVVVRVQASGRLALGAIDLGLLELWTYGADDTAGDAVLQLEN